MRESKKSRILIVKDKENKCESLDGTLDRAGFDCIRATGGEEVLSTAGATPPDLIILDMESPRARGIDILFSIREHDPLGNTPIMVVSRYGTKQDKLVSYTHGANRFVVLPEESGSLLDEISGLLKRRPVA